MPSVVVIVPMSCLLWSGSPRRNVRKGSVTSALVTLQPRAGRDCRVATKPAVSRCSIEAPRATDLDDLRARGPGGIRRPRSQMEAGASRLAGRTPRPRPDEAHSGPVLGRSERERTLGAVRARKERAEPLTSGARSDRARVIGAGVGLDRCDLDGVSLGVPGVPSVVVYDSLACPCAHTGSCEGRESAVSPRLSSAPPLRRTRGREERCASGFVRGRQRRPRSACEDAGPRRPARRP